MNEEQTKQQFTFTYPSCSLPDETRYTITLSDGTKIENLLLNGNSFISDEELDESIFEGNLETLRISDGESEIELSNMRYDGQYEYPDDGWHFCFHELSAQEKFNEGMESKIEYLAMISELDFEEE